MWEKKICMKKGVKKSVFLCLIAQRKWEKKENVGPSVQFSALNCTENGLLTLAGFTHTYIDDIYNKILGKII